MSTAQAAAAQGVDLAAVMAADPGAVIEDVARRHGVTCRQVVDALPSDMRRYAPGSAFADAMADFTRWGDVTLIVNTDDGIMEFTGPIAEGKVAGSYYNVIARTGFHGHLRHERCAAIGFVERPFMGRSSAFVAFFNHEGGIMFKVFVGRDENRELKPEQVKAFHMLAERLGARAP
ncbi:MAG TPA: heme utilization cystosolic carrier protein HutX [Xanthobacteraceae bacterium]|nr:heme utilization cystosolic carrier protein HutX [Xanthobacteraceae bacterium]